MTIAAFATGSARLPVYPRRVSGGRGGHPGAIAAAREANLLGPDILGRASSSDCRSAWAGAYICGEEIGAFESIEGKRGEPRNKPPFPDEYGLFGKPTVVNNVETLANIPLVMEMGGDAHARIGTEGSTGPRLFCLSGHVARPGVYEVEFGACCDLIEHALAAYQAIGRSGDPARWRGGVFVGPDALTMPLTFEATRGQRCDARVGRDHGLRRDGWIRRTVRSPSSSVMSVVRAVRAAGSAASRRSC